MKVLTPYLRSILVFDNRIEMHSIHCYIEISTELFITPITDDKQRQSQSSKSVSLTDAFVSIDAISMLQIFMFYLQI